MALDYKAKVTNAITLDVMLSGSAITYYACPGGMYVVEGGIVELAWGNHLYFARLNLDS
jgi:hypothetical protein